jgi:hypothetical protein
MLPRTTARTSVLASGYWLQVIPLCCVSHSETSDILETFTPSGFILSGRSNKFQLGTQYGTNVFLTKLQKDAASEMTGHEKYLKKNANMQFHAMCQFYNKPILLCDIHAK